MTDIPVGEIKYDLHVVIPAESLPEAIEKISHLKGVVFSVAIHNGPKKQVCRGRSAGNES